MRNKIASNKQKQKQDWYNSPIDNFNVTSISKKEHDLTIQNNHHHNNNNTNNNYRIQGSNTSINNGNIFGKDVKTQGSGIIMSNLNYKTKVINENDKSYYFNKVSTNKSISKQREKLQEKQGSHITSQNKKTNNNNSKIIMPINVNEHLSSNTTRMAKGINNNHNKKIKDKHFFINGVDYFENQTIVDEKAEVMEDCYSIKGDYFYLKKGEIVLVKYRVQQFAEIKYHKFVGYFPSKMFRLVYGGEI